MAPPSGYVVPGKWPGLLEMSGPVGLKLCLWVCQRGNWGKRVGITFAPTLQPASSSPLLLGRAQPHPRVYTDAFTEKDQALCLLAPSTGTRTVQTPARSQNGRTNPNTRIPVWVSRGTAVQRGKGRSLKDQQPWKVLEAEMQSCSRVGPIESSRNCNGSLLETIMTKSCWVEVPTVVCLRDNSDGIC